MIFFIRKYCLALSVAAIIVFLSLFNPPQTNLDGITGIDKLAHLCMYGGLSLVIWAEYLYWHNCISWKKTVLLAIIFPILFSGIMEVAQKTLTDNRQAEWADFLANSIGVIMGAIFSNTILKPIIWKRKGR